MRHKQMYALIPCMLKISANIGASDLLLTDTNHATNRFAAYICWGMNTMHMAMVDLLDVCRFEAQLT